MKRGNIGSYRELDEYSYRLTLMAFSNKNRGYELLISTRLSDEDSWHLKREVKYLMISMVQYFVSKRGALKRKDPFPNKIKPEEYFKQSLAFGIERAFLLPPGKLKLSYEEYKDRHRKYTFLFYLSGYKDIEQSFVSGFVLQVLSGFVKNSYRIDAEPDEILAVGKWVYDTWGVLIEGYLKNENLVF